MEEFTGEFVYWGIDRVEGKTGRTEIDTQFSDQYITTCGMWRPLTIDYEVDGTPSDVLNLKLDSTATMHVGFQLEYLKGKDNASDDDVFAYIGDVATLQVPIAAGSFNALYVSLVGSALIAALLNF